MFLANPLLRRRRHSMGPLSCGEGLLICKQYTCQAAQVYRALHTSDAAGSAANGMAEAGAGVGAAAGCAGSSMARAGASSPFRIGIFRINARSNLQNAVVEAGHLQSQLCGWARQELELAVVQEQAALAAEGSARGAASPLRGVRPAALVHVEALRQQAEAANDEARAKTFNVNHVMSYEEQSEW